MNYKLSADTVRIALCDFLKPETDQFWQRDMHVRVSIGADMDSGVDTFRVDILNMEVGEVPEWRDTLPINSITLDLYRPAPHVQTQLREFAVTTRNLLRLML
jgi:hypothetical protein